MRNGGPAMKASTTVAYTLIGVALLGVVALFMEPGGRPASAPAPRKQSAASPAPRPAPKAETSPAEEPRHAKVEELQRQVAKAEAQRRDAERRLEEERVARLAAPPSPEPAASP